jgi:hypothetical protein
MTKEEFLHELKDVATVHKANIEIKDRVSHLEDSVCNRLIKLIDIAHQFMPEGELKRLND